MEVAVAVTWNRSLLEEEEEEVEGAARLQEVKPLTLPQVALAALP